MAPVLSLRHMSGLPEPMVERAGSQSSELMVISSRQQPCKILQSCLSSRDGTMVKGKTKESGCSIAGVAGEWDATPNIRQRLRDGEPILHPDTKLKQEDIKTCINNEELLAPLLHRMCASPKRSVPGIDDIRDEVGQLLAMNKRQGEDLIVMVEDTAKVLKALCVFIKAKVRRHEVSTATWLTTYLGKEIKLHVHAYLEHVLLKCVYI